MSTDIIQKIGFNFWAAQKHVSLCGILINVSKLILLVVYLMLNQYTVIILHYIYEKRL